MSLYVVNLTYSYRFALLSVTFYRHLALRYSLPLLLRCKVHVGLSDVDFFPGKHAVSKGLHTTSTSLMMRTYGIEVGDIYIYSSEGYIWVNGNIMRDKVQRG